jgi:hypothetical protein
MKERKKERKRGVHMHMNIDLDDIEIKRWKPCLGLVCSWVAFTNRALLHTACNDSGYGSSKRTGLLQIPI